MLFGVPGLTVERIVAAVVTIGVGFFLRDIPGALIGKVRGRLASEDEWREQTRSYLQRLAQVGTMMQASEEIDDEKLDRIMEISEDFASHVSPQPSGIDDEQYWEASTIAYYSGPLAEMLRGLRDKSTVGEAIQIFADYRRRMRLENRDLDELFDSANEGDRDKVLSRLNETFIEVLGGKNSLDPGNQINLAMRLMQEVEGGVDSVEDVEELPWEDIFEPVDDEVQERFIEGLIRDVISIYLIEIPEEAAESL